MCIASYVTFYGIILKWIEAAPLIKLNSTPFDCWNCFASELTFVQVKKKAYTYEYLIILTEISHEEDRSMKWRCASFFVFIELDKYLGQIVVTINGMPEWWQIWDPYYGHDFFFFFSLSKRLVWHSISFVRFFMYFRGILIVKWWTQCSFFFIFFLVFDYSQNIQQ